MSEFSDGEVRQEFSLCFHARPVGGRLAAGSESFEVRWVQRVELEGLDIAPTTRLRLDHGFRNEAAPYLG
ncbi:hypothetical protein ACFV0O_00355 [Kitasatospora sp. NPDC059577]|uniref:hypothetical protein n=1 Tax=Kitasatospora sp. NPDC059577 TaxID=3346873 RepID=UPI0036788E68